MLPPMLLLLLLLGLGWTTSLAGRLLVLGSSFVHFFLLLVVYTSRNTIYQTQQSALSSA
jgi:hypothetical protein